LLILELRKTEPSTMNIVSKGVKKHYRKLSRKRNDSLQSIDEEISENPAETRSRPSELKIVHQTDPISTVVTGRIARAESLVPVIQELDSLLEALLSELYFYKCSFAESGIFMQQGFNGTSRVSQSTIEFMFTDQRINSIRDDDNHNTTYFSRVSAERLLAVVNAIAMIKTPRLVTSYEI
jgi:hypothetical protein